MKAFSYLGEKNPAQKTVPDWYMIIDLYNLIFSEEGNFS